MIDQKPTIPRKPKQEKPVETNGVGQPNGKHALEPEPEAKNLKRLRDEEVEAPSGAKKMKVMPPLEGGEVVVLDDDDEGRYGGSIVIDD